MNKVFLENINGPLGHSIFEEIRTDHESPESPLQILATLDPSDGTERPEGEYELLTVISK
jgi:hypothetical protein